MKMGFTGSRRGMTEEQKAEVASHLLAASVDEFHHGDCIGADAEAHEIATRIHGIKITVHPPTDKWLRAFCKGDEIMPERDYLDRNHDIVDACDVLLACPEGPEISRSGTWATIRYAKKSGKPVHVIDPI